MPMCKVLLSYSSKLGNTPMHRSPDKAAVSDSTGYESSCTSSARLGGKAAALQRRSGEAELEAACNTYTSD
eukprot:5942772-Amphidinium_carterae.1